VRACPTSACGNAGDYNAADGAAFVYATPGEVLPGHYATVPGAMLSGGGGSGDGGVLLVGWGLANAGASGVAVAAAAAGGGSGGSGGNKHAVAVIPAPRPFRALCAVASRGGGGDEAGAVPALSTGAGAVACGSLGSHPAGFRAVLLLTAGGSASAPLLGAQVEFIESAVVVSATPALGPLGRAVQVYPWLTPGCPRVDRAWFLRLEP